MIATALAVGLLTQTNGGFALPSHPMADAGFVDIPPVLFNIQNWGYATNRDAIFAVTNYDYRKQYGIVSPSTIQSIESLDGNAVISGTNVFWNANDGSTVRVMTPEGAVILQCNMASVNDTSHTFKEYLSDSLANLVWTNFIATTNGKQTGIWSTYSLSSGFPNTTNYPVLAWNTNCLMWGMKGETAISQLNSISSSGQFPVTLLTRRHGYARGHGAGTHGFRTDWAGEKVYFCTTNNVVVQMTITNAYNRNFDDGDTNDYTVFIFTADAPASLEPMRVVNSTSLESYSTPPSYYPKTHLWQTPHWIEYCTEQWGGVYVPGYAPFDGPIAKGGDSGSPNMVPIAGELIFYSGRTTSSPSPQMQSDMDTLTTSIGLNPTNYQMQWLDLGPFPSYP